MPNFTGCVFGPFRLRRVLRARIGPDERLVGWGTVHRPTNASTNAMSIAFSLTPVIGPFLGPLMVRKLPRFVILTDRRIILLRADRRPDSRLMGVEPAALIAELPVELLRVREEPSAGWFELDLGSAAPPMRIETPEQHSPAAERLRRALRVMAQDQRKTDAPTPQPPGANGGAWGERTLN